MSKNDGFLSIFKLGLILSLYAAISCAVLALVNNVTAPKIEANQKEKIDSSMKEFFPSQGLTFESISNYPASSDTSIKIESVILAKKDGKITGGAAQVSGPTYDRGTIFVGLNADGSVAGLKFLKLSDSPGFGLKANDPTFKLASGKTFAQQFEGKNAAEGFITNETFDAISGATITSNGIANLLTEGSNSLLKIFKENADE